MNESIQNQPDPIPEFVIAELAAIRATSHWNMLDKKHVIGDMTNAEAAKWLSDHPERYMDALIAMGEWLGHQK